MKKKGISLIVLVITIIVIVILATAVIVTVVQNNPIAKAKEAVLKNDVKDFATELNLALANEKLNDYNFEKESVDAYEIEDIKKYIPSFTDKYYGKLCIEQGRLCFVGGNVTEEEKSMLEASGIQEGSYITKDQIEDIMLKASNIPADATTTDITKYIEGISPEQADKFTIFQGALYYRWEKTSYPERYLLYSNNIPFLPGDANEDGTLTDEDVERIYEFEAGMNVETLTDNFCYISDLDGDGFIMGGDGGIISDALYINSNLMDSIELSYQNPSRLKIVGLYNYLIYTYYTDSNENAAGYDNLVKYFPNITKEHADMLSMYGGKLVFRYDRLDEIGRQTVKELQYDFLLGDVDCNGYVNNDDVKLIIDYTQGKTSVLNELQKELADVDGDGNISSVDYIRVSQMAEGINYNQYMAEYYQNINK